MSAVHTLSQNERGIAALQDPYRVTNLADRIAQTNITTLGDEEGPAND
jgi:hypothetical protein